MEKAPFRLVSWSVFLVASLVTSLALSGCQFSKIENPGKPKPPAPVETTDSMLKWKNHSQIQSGHLTQPYNTVRDLDGNPTLYCFDNAAVAPCVRVSSEMESLINANPAVVQGFQVAVLQDSTSGTVTHEAGWFVTAEPRVSKSKGTFVYIDRQIRAFTGNGAWQVVTQIPTGTCNPTQGDAVGVMPGAAGSEKIVTGLQIVTDASFPLGLTADSNQNIVNYSRTKGYLKAAKIFYGGLLPKDGTEAAPFQFELLPRSVEGEDVDDENFAEVALVGNTTIGDNNTLSLPYYGLRSIDQAELDRADLARPEGEKFKGKWNSHVILGFCYKGVRSGEKVLGLSKTVNRPVVFGITSRLYSPVMTTK